MTRFALFFIIFLALSARACVGFESRIYDINESEYAKLRDVWVHCDDMVVCQGIDKFTGMQCVKTAEREAFPSFKGRIRVDGSKTFTRDELLRVLKDELHKDTCVIMIRPVSMSVTELEPFIAEIGYRRVLVLRIITDPRYAHKGPFLAQGHYCVQLLKDTEEDQLLKTKEK